LVVALDAVLTKPVTTSSGATFIRRNITTRRARAVIVVNPVIDRLLDFIN
jgi:hypothetical protein